jgi:hypothetical protein
VKRLALVLCTLVLTGCTSAPGPGAADLRKPESLLGLTPKQFSSILHGDCAHLIAVGPTDPLRYCTFQHPSRWLPESRDIEEIAWFRDNRLVKIHFLFYYSDPAQPALIVPGLEQIYGPATDKTRTCQGHWGLYYVTRWTFPKFRIECLSGTLHSNIHPGQYKEVTFVEGSEEFTSQSCHTLQMYP